MDATRDAHTGTVLILGGDDNLPVASVRPINRRPGHRAERWCVAKVRDLPGPRGGPLSDALDPWHGLFHDGTPATPTGKGLRSYDATRIAAYALHLDMAQDAGLTIDPARVELSARVAAFRGTCPLVALAEFGRLNNTEIARLIGGRPASVHSRVLRMRKAGWVEQVEGGYEITQFGRLYLARRSPTAAADPAQANLF